MENKIKNKYIRFTIGFVITISAFFVGSLVLSSYQNKRTGREMTDAALLVGYLLYFIFTLIRANDKAGLIGGLSAAAIAALTNLLRYSY